LGAVVLALSTRVSTTSAQTQCDRSGPDVIVGDLPNVTNYGSVGGISAYSVGTTSCNVGDETLLWQATNPNHPVIGQNMYRLKDGRFEQIGISWLKHGFLALAGNACGCGCINPGNGALLGVGCSDPYSAFLNGQQGSGGTGGLGPRFEVNANTGDFVFPYSFLGDTGDSIFKRLQVHNSDLDPGLDGGGQYFVEGHYVTPDDAAAGNKDNNASYRPINVSGGGSSWTISLTGSTEREKPAIRAWEDFDPDVVIREFNDPEGGLFMLGYKCSSNGDGTWHYEYALYNMNSHRSARSFSVPVPEGVEVTNLRFHDVDYHSGEPYDLTDWSAGTPPGKVVWSTDTFVANENANALRWGTLYNFRFDADTAPQSSTVTIGLFREGAPGDPDDLGVGSCAPSAPTVIPTVSQWGLFIMALLLLSAGSVCLRRRARCMSAGQVV